MSDDLGRFVVDELRGGSYRPTVRAVEASDGRAIGQLAKGGGLHWIMSQPIGAAIRITVRRGAETRTLRVIVGHSPAAP